MSRSRLLAVVPTGGKELHFGWFLRQQDAFSTISAWSVCLRCCWPREPTATDPLLQDSDGSACFTKADLPLFGIPTVRGDLLLYRKGLAKRLNDDGPRSAATIQALASQLDRAFLAA